MAIIETCPTHGAIFFSLVCEHIADAVAAEAETRFNCLFDEAVGYLCQRCSSPVRPSTELASLALGTVCSAHLQDWFAARNPGSDLGTAVQKAREEGKRIVSGL